jgi:hypothetical protein
MMVLERYEDDDHQPRLIEVDKIKGHLPHDHSPPLNFRRNQPQKLSNWTASCP